MDCINGYLSVEDNVKTVTEKHLRSKALAGQWDDNKSRQAFLITMQRLANCKSSHELKQGEGRGYIFNNDGNQTTYCYDIDRIKTIDYDRNKVRALVKKLTRESDEVSIKIDEALLHTQVDYEPKFDLAGKESFIIEELMEK